MVPEPLVQHPYTTESLQVQDSAFITRLPGVREVVRQFPDPLSVGRGSLGVEGGLSIVAGPGMGKTSLLRRLAQALESERRIPSALIQVPEVAQPDAPDGFYPFLGQLVHRTREQLRQSPLLSEARFANLRAKLDQEPAWDGQSGGPAMTPRGIERWVGELGQAATHAGGVCLLFDDVDNAFPASWKAALVAALRFTFQASTGITPIYGVWRLFLDESLPGSNYFRNVTRPLFLEPLSATVAGAPGERDALINLALSGASPAIRSMLSALLGGHPQLWQRMLADLCEGLAAPGAEIPSALLEAGAERQRAMVRTLIEGSPKLQATLVRVEESRSRQPYPFRTLPKAVVATGLIDCDADGFAVLPRRVAEVLGTSVAAA